MHAANVQDSRASTQTPALRQLIKEAESLLHELPVTRVCDFGFVINLQCARCETMRQDAW